MKAQACKSANIYFSLKRYHLSSFLQMCLQVIHSLTFSGRIFIDLRFYISRCISQRWSFSSFKLKTGLFYSYPFLFIQICSLEINFFHSSSIKIFFICNAIFFSHIRTSVYLMGPILHWCIDKKIFYLFVFTNKTSSVSFF